MDQETLYAALEKAAREEARLTADKKSCDKRFNNLIGVEQRKQRAILEELDALRAGRTDYLPFTETDWTKEAADRDENV